MSRLILTPRPVPPGLRSQHPTDARPKLADWMGDQEQHEAWAAEKAGASPEELAEHAPPLNACDGCGRRRTLAEWGSLTVRSGWVLCPDCAADPAKHQPLEEAS